MTRRRAGRGGGGMKVVTTADQIRTQASKPGAMLGSAIMLTEPVNQGQCWNRSTCNNVDRDFVVLRFIRDTLRGSPCCPTARPHPPIGPPIQKQPFLSRKPHTKTREKRPMGSPIRFFSKCFQLTKCEGFSTGFFMI